MRFWEKHHYRKGTHCAYCGLEFSGNRKKTKDHIMPLCKGGKNSVYNYIAACKSCNKLKAGLTLFAFANKMRDSKKPDIANRALRVYNHCGKRLKLKYPIRGELFSLRPKL